MIRHAAAFVAALCLSTPLLHAQSPLTLRVSIPSADVHKSPSVGSPVIGRAPRGTDLVVTREVGDWVKISWPGGADGIGYVRANAGTILRGAEPRRAGVAAADTRPTAPVVPRSSPAAAASAAHVTPARPPVPAPDRTRYVTPSRGLGVGVVGGGPAAGFGASARMWSAGRLGAQIDVTRYSFDAVDFLSRATSTDIAPGLLVSIGDHVTDHVWVRPYVGLAALIVHSSRTDLIFLDARETAFTPGARLVGGTELSFSSVPQLGLSADAGYYHRPAPFVGLEPGGIGFSISGRWYVK